MSQRFLRDAGSFRDASGYVFSDGSRIFRGITAAAVDSYRAAESSGLLSKAVSRGLLIASQPVEDPAIRSMFQGARGEAFPLVVEHPRVPVISYPYEWTFSQLQDAALRHLDLQKLALEHGFELSDATAYNMQFIDGLPVHIDVLSIRPYREGRPWEGYNQFCRQFLCPLILESVLGIAPQRIYRGNMAGPSVEEVANLLPLRKRLTSANLMMHIHFHAAMLRGASSNNLEGKQIRVPEISKAKYLAIIEGLRDWIAGMSSARSKKTFWADYAKINSYSDDEKKAKLSFITDTVRQFRYESVADVGGNSGDYSEAALAGGATRAYCLDADVDALEIAYAKRKKGARGLLPLVIDWSDPSPGQGWGGAERKPLSDRLQVDCMMALAVIHHIVIGGNVPLRDFISNIFRHGRNAIIEFVPKSDPMVVGLLRNRDDIFHEYTEESFLSILREFADVESTYRIREGGRVIFACRRKQAA